MVDSRGRVVNAPTSWMRRVVGMASVAALCANGLAAECRGWAQDAPPPAVPTVPPAPQDKMLPVKVTVATDKKVYAVGDTITFTLTVKNGTKQALPLRFSSGQRYDFKLFDAKIPAGARPDTGKPLWQWSRGRMFTMMIASEKLEPGKTLTFSDKYEFKAMPGQTIKLLAAGKYTLVGILTTMGAAPQPSATTTLEIK